MPFHTLKKGLTNLVHSVLELAEVFGDHTLLNCKVELLHTVVNDFTGEIPVLPVLSHRGMKIEISAWR